ncbi:tRNA lysidine(34) synthetase TilS [Shimia haliotis]|uniref:tRNA lysidine(34) synthetase TilS n=1 Tax=Shimia haliotis TaxID=1280847 RepID=UPI0011136A90|nr:tRNA lysidine(34) synthetase TilS [Shimia haliotis]
MTKALDSALGDNIPEKIGVAVSGGGDSMALLDLLRRWGRATVCVASVNHGLRKEAAEEIALVAAYAAAHGMSHDTLDWQWDGRGNLQSAARVGRRGALRAWAERCGIAHVALGHTADDQAETFLMRLARGSGVDGLAGMSEVRQEEGLTWLRPLLTVRRDDLRRHLLQAGLEWADDPSNEDTHFDRVKARKMMKTLAPLGLTVERLVQTADHMARERDVSAWAVAEAKARAACVKDGNVVLDRQALAKVPEAVALRLLADALRFVSGAPYRPRFKALNEALSGPADTALHGCLILHTKESIVVAREWRAVRDMQAKVGDVWDGRWRLRGAEAEYSVGCLGEAGLQLCPQWRSRALPRKCHLASPAVWRDGELIAAPLVGFGEGWYAELINGRAVFG